MSNILALIGNLDFSTPENQVWPPSDPALSPFFFCLFWEKKATFLGGEERAVGDPHAHPHPAPCTQTRWISSTLNCGSGFVAEDALDNERS